MPNATGNILSSSPLGGSFDGARGRGSLSRGSLSDALSAGRYVGDLSEEHSSSSYFSLFYGLPAVSIRQIGKTIRKASNSHVFLLILTPALPSILIPDLLSISLDSHTCASFDPHSFHTARAIRLH